MNMEEAIKKVFEDLNKLSPEELEAELEKHSEGDIAVAMNELSEFIGVYIQGELK